MARGNGPKRMAKQAAIKAGDHPGVHISYHPSETAESIAAYDPQQNRIIGWNSYGWVLHGAFNGAWVEYTIFNRSLDHETLSHILSQFFWDFLLGGFVSLLEIDVSCLLPVVSWEVCLLTLRSSTDEKNCRMLNIEPAEHRLMPAQKF